MKNQYSDFYFLSYENILQKIDSFQYKNDNILETNNSRNMDINFSLIFYNNLFILLHALKKKLRSGQIYMKDAECAESEANFLSYFYFSSYGHFCTHSG